MSPRELGGFVERQTRLECYPGEIVPKATLAVSSFCGRVRVWTPANLGAGLGGVSVGVFDRASARCVAQTSTADDGAFCMSPVKHGRYVAIVCKSGFATNVFELAVTPGAKEQPVEILLELAS